MFINICDCSSLPINDANSPIKGSNIHGFRVPFLSLQPPANRIIIIPNTESLRKKKKKLYSFNYLIIEIILFFVNKI